MACVALGYLLAESWGRRELRFAQVVTRVGTAGLAIGAALAALAAAIGSPTPALSAVAVRALAALAGGWLYHLQRAHVRALLVARQRAALHLVRDAPAAGNRAA